MVLFAQKIEAFRLAGRTAVGESVLAVAK